MKDWRDRFDKKFPSLYGFQEVAVKDFITTLLLEERAVVIEEVRELVQVLRESYGYYNSANHTGRMISDNEIFEKVIQSLDKLKGTKS